MSKIFTLLLRILLSYMRYLCNLRWGTPFHQNKPLNLLSYRKHKRHFCKLHRSLSLRYIQVCKLLQKIVKYHYWHYRKIPIFKFGFLLIPIFSRSIFFTFLINACTPGTLFVAYSFWTQVNIVFTFITFVVVNWCTIWITRTRFDGFCDCTVWAVLMSAAMSIFKLCNAIICKWTISWNNICSCT